jgi:hypothetical protein
MFNSLQIRLCDETSNRNDVNSTLRPMDRSRSSILILINFEFLSIVLFICVFFKNIFVQCLDARQDTQKRSPKTINPLQNVKVALNKER